MAQGMSKEAMRGDTLSRLLERRQQDVDMFVESTMQPELQSNLETYLNNLKNKNKK